MSYRIYYLGILDLQTNKRGRKKGKNLINVGVHPVNKISKMLFVKNLKACGVTYKTIFDIYM
jgi:hypothetical protein